MRCLMISMVVAMCGTAMAEEPGTVQGQVTLPEGASAAIWLEGPAAPAPVAKQLTVSQKGARFVPALLIVPVGSTVNLPNDDRITHNVFSVSPAKKFDLGHYGQGQTRTVKFDKTGVIDLFCNIHENMHAALVVTPNALAALVEGGQFSIGAVPPGTYTVRGYSSELGSASTQVTVSAGGKPSVKLDFHK